MEIFQSKDLVVHLMLAPDQVIEQTINRDQKCSGGIKHVSTSKGSVQRWV